MTLRQTQGVRSMGVKWGLHGDHQAAVMPLLLIAPERMRVNQSLGLVMALKMVADSKPQCIMQFAHRGVFADPVLLPDLGLHDGAHLVDVLVGEGIAGEPPAHDGVGGVGPGGALVVSLAA